MMSSVCSLTDVSKISLTDVIVCSLNDVFMQCVHLLMSSIHLLPWHCVHLLMSSMRSRTAVFTYWCQWIHLLMSSMGSLIQVFSVFTYWCFNCVQFFMSSMSSLLSLLIPSACSLTNVCSVFTYIFSLFFINWCFSVFIYCCHRSLHLLMSPVCWLTDVSLSFYWRTFNAFTNYYSVFMALMCYHINVFSVFTY